MKRILNLVLTVSAVCFFGACSNGDYNANPSSASNSSINPLDPLTISQFTWTGTDPISANIDGAPWVAASYTYSFDSGENAIYGYNGNTVLALFLKDTWADNVYSMGYGVYNSSGFFTDTLGSTTAYYESVLGNSGGIYIIKNDSVSMKGLFYFQGVNSAGRVINITNGYFNISKI